MFDENSDSDGEVEVFKNKDYAARYTIWREKEELQKLKDKYGDEVDEESSSSSETEDENAEDLNPQLERDFFKTLSCLKRKDPKIYDDKISFFKPVENDDDEEKSKIKVKKVKPIFLKDYERQQILEKNGFASDEEDSDNGMKKQKKITKTLVKQEAEVRESFKKALNEADSDDDDGEELFKIKKRSKQEQEKEDEDYIEWLKGRKEKIGDKDAENELKYLHDYWNDPKLDEGENFLKDYILNKKYLIEDDENDKIPGYDDVDNLSEDEITVETQEQFEHKFNFRFEEPDQEFIKRYPRIMNDTIRKEKDKRRKKRAEVKTRKQMEKERKRQELLQLKALKLKEILSKLDKIRDVAGDTNVDFENKDLEEDFDPEAHDKRMQKIFNEEFYDVNEDGKPIFEEDEEIDGDIEDWDNWNGEETELHCEDAGFNMDADYDPNMVPQNEDGGGKKKKKGKKKFAELVKKQKPVFDPKEKSFEKYLDEYYKLDYEDIIAGDVKCRFKYRETVANDFGLSTEEILKADDKELNAWCSVKKTCKYRPTDKELYDVKAYQKKAKDFNKKKRVLASVYNSDDDDKEKGDTEHKKKKRRKTKKQNEVEGVSDVRLRAYGINPTKYKNKLKYGKK